MTLPFHRRSGMNESIILNTKTVCACVAQQSRQRPIREEFDKIDRHEASSGLGSFHSCTCLRLCSMLPVLLLLARLTPRGFAPRLNRGAGLFITHRSFAWFSSWHALVTESFTHTPSRVFRRKSLGSPPVEKHTSVGAAFLKTDTKETIFFAHLSIVNFRS